MTLLPEIVVTTCYWVVPVKTAFEEVLKMTLSSPDRINDTVWGDGWG